MELNNVHRQTLVDELETLLIDREIRKKVIKNLQEKEEGERDETLIFHMEIQDFLLQQSIEVVKKALRDNQIDY